ncbi:hypothetical protein O181_006247 [Austropuccinia psidii MF-1]|uniref:Uncharacterized protein n=1 Tax=Austropuccinia psidii MF-1 TaxID=1389203 RepID=A0A9Q3BKE2_9BASI|nr:hypothetical protein [Austropuccinia psidii MF-1]
MITSLLDWSEVIIWPMKDGNGKRKFKSEPIVTHGIQTSITKPTESPATRHSCSLYALQANSAAIEARAVWHLMAHWIPPPSTPTPVPSPEIPAASSPHSHDEAWQEFMDLRWTLMIPREIFHKSISQILLEHHQLLHMIPSLHGPSSLK